MKWDITLSGNMSNAHLMFSTNPVDARILHATITDNEGLFFSAYVLARAKAVEIFEFIDDLDAADCLLDNKKLLAITHVKHVRNNPYSIMQMFLGFNNTQVMKVRQVHKKRGNVSNSKATLQGNVYNYNYKASLLGDLTDFLKHEKSITRCLASTGQLRKTPSVSASTALASSSNKRKPYMKKKAV